MCIHSSQVLVRKVLITTYIYKEKLLGLASTSDCDMVGSDHALHLNAPKQFAGRTCKPWRSTCDHFIINDTAAPNIHSAIIILYDLTRDHKAFFPADSERCFWRWRNSTVIRFDFSHACEDRLPPPDVFLQEPSRISREIQRDGRALEASRLHIPAADRSSWACISLESQPTVQQRDLTKIVDLFEMEEEVSPLMVSKTSK